MSDQTPRERYLAAMAARYGAVVLPVGVRFALDAVFQPLHLRRDPVTAEDLPRAARRALADETRHDTETTDALKLLHEKEPVIADNGPAALAQSPTRRLVILGGPGTGKTTLLKDLVLRAIHDATTATDAPLPIYIALPDLARAGLDVRAYLESQARDLGVGAFAATLWEHLTTGRAFFCLDSLDEVAPALRPDTIALINRMALRWGGTWVIGSRFTEYKGGQFGHEHFAEWELDPLDAALRGELARRIFAALDQESASTAFVAALMAHPQARAWGENPLLLSLAAVAYARGGTLPASRAALYGLVLDAVLATRTPDPARRTELAQLLARVALRLHQTRGRIFTRTDLRAILADVRPDLTTTTTTTQEAAIDALIGCGLMDVVAHETYGFRHQTFGEYLAAAALADDLAGDDDARIAAAWDLAWSKRQYSRWNEVLCLMVGIAIRAHATAGAAVAARWLRALAAQQASAEGDPGDLGLLLALQAVGEATDAGAAWQADMGLAVETEIVAAWVAMMLRKFRHATYIYQQAQKTSEASIERLDPRAVTTGAQTLIAIARDAASFERIAALNVLATLGQQAPVADLRALLSAEYGSDPSIRSDRQSQLITGIMVALGAAGEATSHDLFVRVLDDAVLGQWAQQAIGQAIKAGDTWWLAWSLAGLQSAVPAERRRAMRVLGQTGAAAPTEAMVAGALHDVDMDVRVAALKALGGLREHAPIPPLLVALHDPQPTIFAAAQDALHSLSYTPAITALAPALIDADPKVRATIANYLQRQRGVPVGYITAAWALAEDPKLRATLLRLMGNCGARVPIDIILANLHDANAEVAVAALNALAAVSEFAPPEAVLAQFDEENLRDNVLLLHSLGRWGERAPLDRLMTASTHQSSVVRAAACDALGKVGRRDALPVLIARLSDDDWDVRRVAAEAITRLGEPGDELTPAAMLTAFSRCDQDTRAHALRILDALGPEAPMDLLQEALHDPQVEVRAAAIDVLARRGALTPDQIAAALDDPSSFIVVTALHALIQHPDPAFLDRISAFVTGTDASSRQSALKTLAAYGQSMPIAVVLGALESSDHYVRRSAIHTLSALGAEAPADVFMALAVGDPQHRSIAYETLTKMGARIPLAWYLEQLRAHPADIRVIGAILAYANHVTPEQLAQMHAARDMIVRDVAFVIAAWREAGPPDPILWDRWGDLSQALRTSIFTAFGSRLIDFPHGIILDNLLTMPTKHNEQLIAAWSAAPTRAPIAALSEWLRAAEARKRAMALTILGKLGDVVDGALFVAALADPDTHVRGAAAEVLRRRLDQPVSLETLFAAMIPGETYLNMELARTIAARGDMPPLDEAIEQLSDSDYTYAAASLFTILGARAPVEPLLLALGNSDGEIVNSVLEAITVIDRTLLRRVQPEAERILRDYVAGDIIGAQMAEQFTWGIQAMERVPAAFFTELTTLLDAPYAPVVMSAIRALTSIRRNIPDMTLRRLLALRRDAPTPTLRTAADGALAAILSLENGMEDDS